MKKINKTDGKTSTESVGNKNTQLNENEIELLISYIPTANSFSGDMPSVKALRNKLFRIYNAMREECN